MDARSSWWLMVQIFNQIFHEEFQNPFPGAQLVQIICESTGGFTAQEKAELHLKEGTKKVIMSAPPKDAVPTYVLESTISNTKLRILWCRMLRAQQKAWLLDKVVQTNLKSLKIS